MKLNFSSLTLERYRTFRALKIHGLGRVNLLTGKNNTGKSSVLEALRILSADDAPSIIHSILKYREEDIGCSEEQHHVADAEELFQVSPLFNGFPDLSSDLEPITMSATGGRRPIQVQIDVKWLSPERDDNAKTALPQQQANLFGEGEKSPALVIRTNETERGVRLNSFHRYPCHNRFRYEMSGEQHMPCIFVSPYGGERTSSLGALWDKIALSDMEHHVVKALKIIDPKINKVSMIGGIGSSRSRTAIVRAKNFSRPVPLRSYGDGMNRLFGIILSLVNVKKGLLLIDEFENGMHHTVQLDAWRAVFLLSKKLDIQVFATSHNWDSIEAFQQAASESSEKGVLVRLAHKGEDIIPTLFSEKELAVATRDKIEVR